MKNKDTQIRIAALGYALQHGSRVDAIATAEAYYQFLRGSEKPDRWLSRLFKKKNSRKVQ